MQPIDFAFTGFERSRVPTIRRQQFGWRWPQRRRIVTVAGDLGQAVWDEDKKTVEVFYNQVQERRLNTVADNHVIHAPADLNPLAIELQHFFDCVETRQQPKTDLYAALKVARAIDAAGACL